MRRNIAILLAGGLLLVSLLACAAPDPVVEQVEVTRVVLQTVVVEATVPVTRVVERTVETPVTRVVTKEVPVTVLVTPTSPPATATPIPTATALPTATTKPTATPEPVDLANAERANLWLAIYAVEWCAPCVGVSADPAFDVAEFGELMVIVSAGRRSETFFNVDRIYGDDGYVELSQTLDGRISSVTGVSAESNRIGSLRCEKHKTSDSNELVYACAWR